MSAMLQQFFGWLCGQFPLHTWASGGIPLPCCQRCTGLYLGSLAALVLHSALRPALTLNFVKVHGLFLLMMVPFGFHWIPQGPLLRCWSGMLFGLAVVTFLRLPMRTAERAQHGSPPPHVYSIGVALSLAGTATLHQEMAPATLQLVSVLVACGAVGLLTLVFIAMFSYLRSACRFFRSAGLRPAAASSATGSFDR